MVKEKLIKVHLSEKGICTDWIKKEIYNNETIGTSNYNFPTISILGLYRNCLVETTFSHNNNYVRFHFIQSNPYNYSTNDVEELINRVNELTKDDENIVLQIKKYILNDGDTIVVFRFFVKE